MRLAAEERTGENSSEVDRSGSIGTYRPGTNRIVREEEGIGPAVADWRGPNQIGIYRSGSAAKDGT